MKRLIVVILLFAAALALATYLRARGDVRSTRHRYLDAEVLDGSLDLLVEAFNERQDSPRLLAVLSPSCPVCFSATETILNEIVEPGLEIEVLVVWMEVLPYDITRNPARRIVLFSDQPRVRQFYDSDQLAGRELAEHLDWPDERPAWDVYLFFEAGQTWGQEPPEPVVWFHQHQSVSGPYRTVEEFGPNLMKTVDRMLESRPAG